MGCGLKNISPGRRVAFEVLEEVAGGAFASDALREACVSLSVRDAGLAGQIVFGSLRVQNQLDYLIELYSGRAAESLHLLVRIALRAAIYQIRYLERVPAHAAVNDSVEFVKYAKRAASGLANAVLRKAGREEIAWPTESVRYSCPHWLLARWAASFGHEQALQIASAALVEPERYVRITPGSKAAEGLEPTEVAGCYRLISSLSEPWRLHDISSQAIVPLLDLQPGQTYLDVCAAPGNKTLQALETALQLAVACDISEKRIGTVPPLCQRVVLDATQPLPFALKFQRIFIDAPCSGTGTLARNPEIKWRLQAADIPRFKHRQLSILHQAVRQLSDDGLLVYATCSLEEEETRQVLAQTLIANPGLVCLLEQWRLPGRDAGDGFYAAVLTRKSV
jgi:16S rRNA (cytosine967-C5)-methyltransferase